VGFDSPASCAAIRCAIDHFSETRFADASGEWIIGAQVLPDDPRRGTARLAKMVVPAIEECLAWLHGIGPGLDCSELPLLLCVAEQDRPGRLAGLDEELLRAVEDRLGVRFHPSSQLVPRGRIAGAVALGIAREMIREEKLPCCLLAGVDTFLEGETLAEYERRGRLLTSQNSNGFIPGEAAAAILVGRAIDASVPHLSCLGVGIGQETATMGSGKPFRADGLVQAIKAALTDARCGFEDLDFRVTDCNGEQYWFREAALALARVMRVRKEAFDVWHAADCIGEVGAASALCAIGVTLASVRKAYAPGPRVLGHFGCDSGQRAAVVLRATAAGMS
jgi:3-oxoacyl-[acyl-carrier-protein] synthase-1